MSTSVLPPCPLDAHRLLTPGTQILALGEPVHGEPGFPLARNALLDILAEQGIRSIALETDAVAALRLAAIVGGSGDEDGVTAGFSHSFGEVAANRELIGLLRARNAGRPYAEHVTIYGFDAPTEMADAPSPRPYLLHLHDYLAAHRPRPDRAALEGLLGDDARWAGAGVYDPEPSRAGARPQVAVLRAAVDDLLGDLLAQAPALIAATSMDAWWAADLHGRAARGLLRYHATHARGGDFGPRTAALAAVRDALMAENLLAIRARERDRGPTLVFAHNLHLRRSPSALMVAGEDAVWSGAGSIVAAVLGQGYRFVAGVLGASPALEVGRSPEGTREDLLAEATGERTAFVDGPALRAAGAGDLPARADLPQIAFPLDTATLDGADAVLYVTTPPAAVPLALEDLADRIAALPGVQVLVGEGPDIPPSMVGARFFYAGDDRRMPFATIVEHDTPGGDEESALHRPGTYRLNLQLGREGFRQCFGHLPRELAGRRGEIDFTALDVLVPHPVYGDQGWGAITSPTRAQLPRIERILRTAHARAESRRAGAPGS